MANIKITDLTAYTNPDATDVLPIVDVGAGITKQISIENLLKNASSGTAAAPGIAFDGDSNTGIYRPDADQLAISTNGAGRLFVNSSGDVGIGTVNPAGRLEIATGAGTACQLVVNEGTTINPLSIEQNATEARIQTNASQPLVIAAQEGAGSTSDLRFNTRSQERLRITSDGKLGLGTSAPGSALEVRSDGSGLAQILRVTRHNGEDAGVFRIDVDPGADEIHYCATGSQGGAHVWTQGSAASEKARIDSAGRLLVGTSSDFGGALLQVDGNRVRISTAKTPASSSDTGTTGEICWDANYIYVCTATNTWKRAALSTW